MYNQTCCFIGHRNIEESDKLRIYLYKTAEKLITKEGVDIFLFGSKSRFNGLCYEIISELKEKYPHIKRIYVRAEFPVIDESYEKYLRGRYEETYYPKRINGAGKAVYIERNREMIDKSRYCVFYFDENINYKNRKSGTKAAFDYAKENGKEVLNAHSLSS